ncbi:MAG TPA: transposase [Steroidobacteraceae bacterium]|nr:transposase [Steroidobacteraceae bacterium]
MPRVHRVIAPGHYYHFYNRGHNRMQLFHGRRDYIAFLWLLAEAMDLVPVPLFAACLMPNHVHFVFSPLEADDLARWAHWLFTTHAGRYRHQHQTSGSVWGGRFKTSLVQDDRHLLTVLRYVERNALRARLVERAERWEWGSASWRTWETSPLFVASPPIALPDRWLEFVNAPQTAEEVAAIRRSLECQLPFGDDEWRDAKAREFGIRLSGAPRGRPRRPIVTTK